MDPAMITQLESPATMALVLVDRLDPDVSEAVQAAARTARSSDGHEPPQVGVFLFSSGSAQAAWFGFQTLMESQEGIAPCTLDGPGAD
jgi:histidinol phosphatase-like PHP family hydrolase